MGDVPDTDSNEPNSAISLLRWIAVLPCWLVSGWGAYVAIYWLSRFTFSFSSMNPDSFFNRLFIEGVSHCTATDFLDSRVSVFTRPV